MNYQLGYRVYISQVSTKVDMPANLVPTKYVQDISISHTMETDFTSGVTLGRLAPPEATLTLIKNSFNPFTQRLYNWRLANVLIMYSINSIDYYPAFAGFIESRFESLTSITMRACGYLKYLDYYRHLTPLWENKPVATIVPDPPVPYSSETWGVLNSSQDPTTLSGSLVGTVNTILWLSGGRPFKYKQYLEDTDQNPKFYFDCDPSIMTPKFTWLNQEDVTEDLTSLCVAGGGQITQSADGVVKFVNALSYTSTTNNFVLNDSMFTEMTVDEEAAVTFGKVITTFSPRYLGANKAIVNLSLGKYLPYGEEYEHELEFSQPVSRLTNNTYYGSGISFAASGGYFGIDEFITSRDFVKAVDYNGDTASVSLKVPRVRSVAYPKNIWTWNAITASGVWTVVEDAAKTPGQFMKVIVRNDDIGRSLYLSKLVLYGIPLVAGEQQTIKRDIPLTFSGLVTAGIVPSGFREIRMTENAYVQSKDHAMRLLNVVSYLSKMPRPVHRFANLVYEPSLKLADVITINSTLYQVQGKFKVVEIAVTNTGARMSIACVNVTDLHTREEFFIIGQSYQSSDYRLLSW